jgi:hypothetical protein
VFHTLIAVIVIIFFLLACSSLSYNRRLQMRNRRSSMPVANFDRHFYKRATKDPEEQYIEGIGIIIGDISCTYNARSPYIRCAVNPDGLCQDCRHYQREEE